MTSHEKEVIVETNSCRVKGLSKKSLLGDDYYSFQAIPYAKNPVGDLRFKAPVPVDSCPSDIIDARFEGPVPFYVESHFETYPQSENCLHLNVYSKNLNPLNQLAVIVFIYGGAFNSGSSMTKLYGPDYFMQKDVVLVTFNYRVGPLGFLHFDDPTLGVAGNAGLKDQLLVLKWVQANIEKFGGNKNNVTLVGDSAGAGSVSYHLASEASKNLFHRAILMSGTTFCDWGVMAPNHLGFYLANATGWNGNGGEKGAYAHLLTVDPEVLTKASTSILTDEHRKQGLIFPFGPMVENYDTEMSFLREHPVKLLRNAWSKDIDIVIGCTSLEGLMVANTSMYEEHRKSNEPSLFIPFAAQTGKSQEQLSQDVKKIKALYNNFQDKKSFYEFVSDSRFVHGAHRNVLSRLHHPGLGKTYFYRFSYDFPERNHHKIVFGAKGLAGAAHADDLSYIFTNGWAPPPAKDTAEWNAIQKTLDFYVGFAIHGSQKMQEIGWNEVKKEDLPYNYEGMEIDQEWRMQKMPELSRMPVWDDLFQKSDLYCRILLVVKTSLLQKKISLRKMTQEVLIDTKSGRVKGLYKESLLGDEYFSFQSIPYAKAPIGELRFKAPVPIDPWEGTVDATKEGPVPHYARSHFGHLVVKCENCLHLNVYSKNVHPTQKLPVIIFIYGGTFNSGSSSTTSYGPDYFMQKDVVLVTFNYRVGPLGFLHFNDPSLNIPGNAGLKDQLLVLKWVQANIEAFGGDKDNVTLVGNSAGAASVGYHLLVEASKDLFHRAVLMSGTAFSTWSVMPPNTLSLDLAKETGWDGNGGDRGAYEHLLTVDADTLMEKSKNLLTKDHLLQGILLAFAPMVETYDSESSFMREHPIKLARNAWSKNIDIVVGFVTNEGLFQTTNENKMFYKMVPSYHLVVPQDARKDKSEEILMNHGENIKKVYNDFQDLSTDNLKPFFDFVTDLTFLHSIHRNILSRFKHESTGKTFLYRFSYHFPTRNHRKHAFGAAAHDGVCHGDDLSYLFTNAFGPVPEKDTDEWHAVQKTVQFLTDFATKGSQKMEELEWKEIEKHELPYDYCCMQIGHEWKYTKVDEIYRMQAWDTIYEEHELC
ncbi:uncharacterized protein LOC134837636 [Culicoides brevitarsis]|uniref:uncharacterized protein LOC134837636 n=1 Tax=Culicoides brevitarsis TaxID=469753 RepID=UPI00307C4BC2